MATFRDGSSTTATDVRDLAPTTPVPASANRGTGNPTAPPRRDIRHRRRPADVDWPSLAHAYGPADDMPGLLAALRVPDAAARRRARRRLAGSVFHQGDRYSATAPTIPDLIAAADDPGRPTGTGSCASSRSSPSGTTTRTYPGLRCRRPSCGSRTHRRPRRRRSPPRNGRMGRRRTQRRHPRQPRLPARRPRLRRRTRPSSPGAPLLRRGPRRCAHLPAAAPRPRPVRAHRGRLPPRLVPEAAATTIPLLAARAAADPDGAAAATAALAASLLGGGTAVAPWAVRTLADPAAADLEDPATRAAALVLTLTFSAALRPDETTRRAAAILTDLLTLPGAEDAPRPRNEVPRLPYLDGDWSALAAAVLDRPDS
ncbi:hypothetical protein ACU686_34510 [Yinghuangia aomiensis]